MKTGKAAVPDGIKLIEDNNIHHIDCKAHAKILFKTNVKTIKTN